MARKPKIYIAGPMTGVSLHNVPAFLAAAEMLRSAGWEVLCPGEWNMDKVGHWTWREFMIYDIKRLVHCDAVYMLKGWQSSKGAIAERDVAQHLGLMIFSEYTETQEAMEWEAYDFRISAEKEAAWTG